MSIPDREIAAERSVSVVADGALAAALRAAVDADPSLRLTGVVARFTELVTEAEFPGDVVLLAEASGAALFAHAQTALAAGALVIVHADVSAAQQEALEQAGVAVVPRDEAAAAVVSRIGRLRPTGRRGQRTLDSDVRPRPRLSRSERRALAHYVQGRTTVQVAAEMGVGYETAKTFLRRVRAKYAAVDRAAGKRAQLIARAEEDGIL
ncbi:DNA-binding response regulator [Agrococcus sp. ProA11]|uniref:helix-turn-helix transcriptional regulator n=1 Tax=Agrococcus chionoecetis TaxID=3153752 RepID=UPI00326157E2